MRSCLAIVLSLFLVPAAGAVCDFCNPSIRLNERVAACFAEQYEAELVRLEAEGRGFVLVDLTQCVEDRTRGLPSANAQRDIAAIDTSFVADEAALRCINAEIGRLAGSLDPVVRLDLTACP